MRWRIELVGRVNGIRLDATTMFAVGAFICILWHQGGFRMRQLRPLACFRTNRDQLYCAWTQDQLERAIRLNWTALWGDEE